MKRFASWIILAAALAAGCGKAPVDEAKVEAYNRWHLTRAKVLVSLGRKQLGVGEMDKALASASEALKLKEDYTEARVLLGKVLIEKGQYAHAIAQLRRCTKEQPESSRCAYLLGVALERHGMLQEALDSYLLAEQLDDKDFHPVVAAGEVMVSLGQVQRAQEHVEGFIGKTVRDDPALYELAGRIASMRQEHERAARHFLAACDLAPGTTSYQELLGRSQMAAGRYAEAAETFGQLGDVEDYQAPAWVYSMLGQCHMALDNPNRARTAFDQAAKMNGNSPEVWCDLARAELANGDAGRAVLSAREALQQDKNHLDGTLLLAFSLMRTQQNAGAIRILSAASVKHPKSTMVHCLLGKAYAADGKLAKATESYREALRLDPRNAAARELLKAARQNGREVSSSDETNQ
ncbi:MAG: tetratricopeptide repeat protein [Phycisphaerae bacterium]